MYLTIRIALLAAALALVTAQCPSRLNFAVGSYTRKLWLKAAAGAGVSLMTYDDSAIQLTSTFGTDLVGENPAYLAVAPNRIYAANTNGRKYENSSFSRLSVRSGLSVKSTTRGRGASHIYRDGMMLVASNFFGSIATLRSVDDRLIDLDSFTVPLEFAAARRNPSLKGNWMLTEPRPHMAIPFKTFYAVPDLGSGMVHLFKIDKRTGKIKLVSSFKVEQTDGPRHAAVHSRGDALYVVNQLSLTISTLYLSNDNKTLEQRSHTELTSLNEAEKMGVSAKAIRVSADGKFLYASVHYGETNKGTIVGFRLNESTGEIQDKIFETTTHGIYPRDFIIIEKLRYGHECVSVIAVVNRDSDNLVLIRRDMGSGTIHGTIMAEALVKTPTSVILY